MSFLLWYRPRTFSVFDWARGGGRITNWHPRTGKFRGRGPIRSDQKNRPASAPMRQSINADGSNLIECDEWVFFSEWICFWREETKFIAKQIERASWWVFCWSVCCIMCLVRVFKLKQSWGIWFGARQVVFISIWFNHWITRDKTILKLSRMFLCYRCLRMTQFAWFLLMLLTQKKANEATIVIYSRPISPSLIILATSN